MTTDRHPAAGRRSPRSRSPCSTRCTWASDEYGEHVHVNLAERNMLLGGEPGAGKSSGLNLIIAHGALSRDCKLILVDGKQVELGLWRACADMFIGPSITDAIAAFEAFQATMNTRYDNLLAGGPPQDHPRRPASPST